MTGANEFSRMVRVDTLGGAPRTLKIEAEAHEREALATRFGLEAVDRLEAEMSLVRSGETITATGLLFAEVTQSCVATAAPVPARIEEPFTILFQPERQPAGADEEIELSEEECDIVFYAGAMIDVGEAVAETLALSLDPWPRSPEADAVLEAEGVKSQEEAEAEEAEAKLARSPFAALKPKP